MSAEEEFVDRILRSARAGGASEFDIATLRLRLLQGCKFETLSQALRVKDLERKMYASMDSGERCVAICEILGISERRFYELRKLASAIPDRSEGR